MRWRQALSMIIAFIGALGPAVVLLFKFGATTTLKQVDDNDPGNVLFVLLLVLASIVCALAATGLMRLDVLAQLRRLITGALGLRNKREA